MEDIRSSRRLEWLDIAKGIAIICTIIGHSVEGGTQSRNLIFSFHMPLFFLIAGYTIKDIPRGQLGKATWKDFKRLIVPCFAVLGMNVMWGWLVDHRELSVLVLEYIGRFLWGNGSDYVLFGHPVRSVGVLWFLIALFWSKLAYRLALRFFSQNRIFVLLFGALVGIWIGRKVRLPQGLDLVLVILVFLEVGYLAANKTFTLPRPEILAIPVFFVWVYLAWDKGYFIEFVPRAYPFSIGALLIALCGCYCVLGLSKALESLKVSKALSLIGRHSLDLLCIHSLDGYWSFLFYVSDDGAQALIRVAVDVAFLCLWLMVKKVVKNKCNHVAAV